MTPQIVAVDHFAGTGWAVACRWLGILEYGVEMMPAAIRTRSANGFRTIYRDVWSGLLHPSLVPAHSLHSRIRTTSCGAGRRRSSSCRSETRCRR